MADSDISIATLINIPLERSLYVGITLSGIFYGLEISVFFTSVHCISSRPSEYRKGQISYIVYGAILLALDTIQLACYALWCQFLWIDHRNYPGGPLPFYRVSAGAWYIGLGFATNAMANFLCDGLLLYRCSIIWNSKWYVIVLPALVYLASSVIAVIAVVSEVSHKDHTSLLNREPDYFTMLWVLLSVTLNVIVTSMICFRILRVRALTREVLPPEMSNMYTSIVTMLIESAAPLSILGIGFAITAARSTPLLYAFGFVWFMFCSLSPQMIILRVAMNRGWLRETANELNTALVFAQPVTTHEQSQMGRVTICNTGDSMSPKMPDASTTTT